jgi:hypothetical protein
MKKITLVSSAVVASMVVGLSGCGSSSTPSATTDTGSSSGVSLSGSLGSSYAYYKAPWYKSFITKAYALGFGQINNAVAIPIINGEAEIAESVDISINSSGEFTANLQQEFSLEEDGETHTAEANWIVLLEKNDGSIDFLSIPNSTGSDSLVNFPISQATSSSIDLGLVTNNGNEARTDLKLDGLSQKVTYNINELNQLATMDDVLKSIVNRYKNNKGKSEDEMIGETLHVVSNGNYANLTNDYEKASNFAGYAFHFHGGKNSLLATKFQNICDTNDTLKLIPPNGATITANSVDYNTNNPFISKTNGIENNTDGSKQCEGSAFYARKDSEGVVLNFITGDDITMLANTKPIPGDYFQLKLSDGTLIGNYELSYGLPLYSNNTLKVPIPALKLDVDSNTNNVNGAYIKWYMYDGTNFNEVDDATLRTMISYFSTHGNDFNGKTGSTNRVEFHCNNQDLNTTYVNLRNCQNFPSSGMQYNYSQEDEYSLDQIQVNIYIGASEYRFSYRK